ncbi:MAG: ABC transporter permease/substrate-binding protein [Clostridia bacterium]
MNSFLQYFLNNLSEISILINNHIQFTIISILIAIMIGVPLGILIYNSKQLNKPIMSLANLIQAVPSLAILGFLVPYLGIGASTAIFMVVLYSLLPILKNTYAGLMSINKDTLEAARGIGMTNTQILTKVQLPLALPVIMAGIRVSSVTAVGLMTIAAYIGANVLGTLVIAGIQTNNVNMILSGAIPACILALVMDFLMGKIEKAVTPISLQLTTANLVPEKIEAVKRSKKITAVSMGVVLVFVIATYIGSVAQPRADIIVGSKDATEGEVIGYLISQLIAEKTDLVVEERMSLGGTSIAFSAIISNEIDIYPDYTGTLYSSVYSQEFVPGMTSNEVYLIVKDLLYSQDKLHGLEYFDFNNEYAIAVTQETAEKYNLKTISDLKPVASLLKIGGVPEFNARNDGLLGIQDVYGLNFGEVLQFSGALMYIAIDANEVDVISAYSTDSMVANYNLVALEDDLNFFPPYNMIPVINQKVFSEYPEVIEILEVLNPLLTNEVMRELNGRVTDYDEHPKTVAINFLKDRGLID